jgi:hypothetical protein
VKLWKERGGDAFQTSPPPSSGAKYSYDPDGNQLSASKFRADRDFSTRCPDYDEGARRLTLLSPQQAHCG